MSVSADRTILALLRDLDNSEENEKERKVEWLRGIIDYVRNNPDKPEGFLIIKFE